VVKAAICSVVLPTGQRCPKPVYARGWCNAHWTRNRRWGDPLGGGDRRRPHPVQWAEDGSGFYDVRGRVIRFDAADEVRVEEFTWTPTEVRPDLWYAMSTYRAEGDERSGPKLYMHRHLTGWKLIDHINGDGLDNRRANLRQATTSQNMANRRKQQTFNGKPVSSQYLGVTWDKTNKAWRAQVKCDGKRYRLGLFKREVDAALAYDRQKRELFGEFARLNFPDR
jgi:hypothetical protein